MTHRQRRLIEELARAILGDMPRSTGKAAYQIWKRGDTGRYYFHVLDPSTGEYGKVKTTGQTNRSAAETWVIRFMAESEESNLTLAEFAAGMFDEGSAYLVYREQRGKAVGTSHRKHDASYLRRYVTPFLGRHKLSDLTHLQIEEFQSWLLQQPKTKNSDDTLSPSTVNKVIDCLRLIIKWALHQGAIADSPFTRVEALRETPRERGMFKISEIEALFSLGDKAWPDPLSKLLHKVAARCGLRMGELLALRRECVTEIPLADGRLAAVLLVDRNWSRERQLKSTKSGKQRVVPLPPFLYSELRDAMARSPWQQPDHFLFYSVDAAKPMSPKKVDKDFRRAVAALGFTEQERRSRNLTFHSLRHFANTFMLDNRVPEHVTQQIIGHQSRKMTDLYTHQTEEILATFDVLDRPFTKPKSTMPSSRAPFRIDEEAGESSPLAKLGMVLGTIRAGLVEVGRGWAVAMEEEAKQRAVQRPVEGNAPFPGLRNLPTWARVLEEYSLASPGDPLLAGGRRRIAGQEWTLFWYGQIGQIRDLYEDHLYATGLTLRSLVDRLYTVHEGDDRSLHYERVSYDSVKNNVSIALDKEAKAWLRRHGFPPTASAS